MLIGTMGFPTEECVKQYPVLNYARTNMGSTSLIKKRNLLTTINVGYLKEDKSKKTIEEYMADIEEAVKFSLEEKSVIDIAQDDYLGWYNFYKKKNVRNIKKIINKNPSLLYGATIYEDDLTKFRFMSGINNYIDIIHFYLHKRNHITRISSYLSILKGYFPKAKIILGIYNMDRRNYEKRDYHTKEDEINLFQKQLKKYISLMDTIDGIEFFPGGLGNEENLVKNRNITGDSKEIYFAMANTIKLKLESLNSTTSN